MMPERALGSPERNLDKVSKRKGHDTWGPKIIKVNSTSFTLGGPTSLGEAPCPFMSAVCAHTDSAVHLLGGGHPKAFAGPSQTKVEQCVYSQIQSARSPPCWASKGAPLPGLTAIWLWVGSKTGRPGRQEPGGRSRGSASFALSLCSGRGRFPPWLQLPLDSPSSWVLLPIWKLQPRG